MYSISVHLCSWKTCNVLFAILLIISTLLVLSQHSFDFTASVVKGRRKYVNKQNRCTGVLQQMRYGKWRPRQNLRPEDELHRQEQDLRIRTLRGLPRKLYRDDMRCGNKYPLHSPNFDAIIPSLCDHLSASPCCNHELATCGAGHENCSCERCTDFRKIITAEVNEFVSSSGCEFKNFTSQQACQLLSQRVSSLVLIGDSLVRHIYNALTIIFTDDAETGCLDKDLEETDRGLCSGDMQFVDSGKSVCQRKTARITTRLPAGKFCQGKQDFDYFFHAFYTTAYAKLALNAVRERLNKTNSVIAIGVGLHIGLNVNQVFRNYLGPIFQLKKHAASKWPLIVWLTTHAQGSLKPIAYFKSQSNAKISKFNRDMRELLEPIGVPVFDTFNLTLGVHSYDGTHYGFGVNMMKAQLFLNFLDETFQHEYSPMKS